MAMVLANTVESSELRPPVEFPHATPVIDTVKVTDIVGIRHVQRVEVLLDKALVFESRSLQAEIARMMLLLDSRELESEPPLNLLALEDLGPTILVTLSDGNELIIRRVHVDCYRLYWSGKTAWFRFDRPSNQGVQRDAGSAGASDR
jgi:hypothetical protein